MKKSKRGERSNKEIELLAKVLARNPNVHGTDLYKEWAIEETRKFDLAQLGKVTKKELDAEWQYLTDTPNE